MIIDLIAMESSPYRFAATIAPAKIDLESEGAALKSSARIEADVTRHIAQADIEGEINADVELECSRCLQPVARNLKFSFRASFVAPENYSEAKETELRADDLEIAILESNTIDIAELIREQILLNLPAQVYCAEDCKGLCPQCGANRNLIDCKCEEKEIDPRWAALKNLK
jgi:uncharacterized protein